MESVRPCDDSHSEMRVSLLRLPLKKPFRIAHGTSSERVVLRIRWKGALGEAPFVPYYPDTPESVCAWFERVHTKSLQSMVLPEDTPAVVRLAVDVLQNDLRGRHLQKPVWHLHGLKSPVGVSACRSLGIPMNLEEFAEDVRRTTSQFEVVKLKLGSGNTAFDEAVVATAREAAPSATLFGDVNGGWSVEETLNMLPRMKRLGLSFVEQPLHHAEGIASWKSLHSHLTSPQIPLYADESIQNIPDLQSLSEIVQGVNVKLLKTMGFSGALNLVTHARALGLKVILGCMVESSIGVTAAAHLAGICDWVDLDGHLYLREDDFEGITFSGRGRVQMRSGAGLGIDARQGTSLVEEQI